MFLSPINGLMKRDGLVAIDISSLVSTGLVRNELVGSDLAIAAII